ncbi:MAG: M23 family metallopeptidase [Rhizobiaceae bacterium]
MSQVLKLAIVFGFILLYISGCNTTPDSAEDPGQSALTKSPVSGPPIASHGFGDKVNYGQGKHPGLDYALARGTPIVAPTSGTIITVGDPCPGQPNCGGQFVTLRVGNHFKITHGHLRSVVVQEGASVKRGQLLGYSGASNDGNAHLHFGVCKLDGRCINYTDTIDPNTLWLGNSASCFDPERDYSSVPETQLTHPVKC